VALIKDDEALALATAATQPVDQLLQPVMKQRCNRQEMLGEPVMLEHGMQEDESH
jgi:hypothetical protein